ncbi:hypothetical protein Tco_0909893 [Tanacetum coccineum]|uniref:Uncharacterized protein n=1 Tax=Tanacetum coccineum TaxID=301880 RepID=A0ABQ5CRR4_9ASTR
MFDEPLGNDSKPISYDVTFSNSLFDLIDDYTLCYDNPVFNDEFEDISSLDLPELTPVIDESTLLVTLSLPCTDVLGDAIVDIDLLFGEHVDTLSTEDKEINFNPSRDIEEIERLLADDPIPVPRVFDEPLGNSDSMSRSSETSDLFEELVTEFGLDDSIPTEIDDRYHDSEDSSSLDLPLPDPKQIFLREVERFDPFFSLTQSGGKTRVMETSSFVFHHMPSPCPTAYSPKGVMYRFYHPHLTSGDGFNLEIKRKLSKLPNKYQKDVLRTLLFGNSSLCTLYTLFIINILINPMPINVQHKLECLPYFMYVCLSCLMHSETLTSFWNCEDQHGRKLALKVFMALMNSDADVCHMRSNN